MMVNTLYALHNIYTACLIHYIFIVTNGFFTLFVYELQTSPPSPIFLCLLSPFLLIFPLFCLLSLLVFLLPPNFSQLSLLPPFLPPGSLIPVHYPQACFFPHASIILPSYNSFLTPTRDFLTPSFVLLYISTTSSLVFSLSSPRYQFPSLQSQSPYPTIPITKFLFFPSSFLNFRLLPPRSFHACLFFLFSFSRTFLFSIFPPPPLTLFQWFGLHLIKCLDQSLPIPYHTGYSDTCILQKCVGCCGACYCRPCCCCSCCCCFGCGGGGGCGIMAVVSVCCSSDNGSRSSTSSFLYNGCNNNDKSKFLRLGEITSTSSLVYVWRIFL